jgi:hypothetical protein
MSAKPILDTQMQSDRGDMRLIEVGIDQLNINDGAASSRQSWNPKIALKWLLKKQANQNRTKQNKVIKLGNEKMVSQG